MIRRTVPKYNHGFDRHKSCIGSGFRIQKSYKAAGQDGFSLLEMLIILALLSALLLIVWPIFGHTVSRHEHERFFRQVEEDYLYAQQVALTEHRSLEVKFIRPSSYEIRGTDEHGGETLVHGDLPDGVEYGGITFPNDGFRILPNGNLNRNGSVNFIYDQGRKSITKRFAFQLGTGRVITYDE